MGVLTNVFLVFVLFCVCMCVSQQADVYRLQPKYPAADNDEEGSKASFVSRDTNRIGRRLQAHQTAIFSLKGNVVPYGLYYVTMLVGNPSKPYFLDVDSGSELTWIQCDAPCISCAKGPHPLYKLKKGSLVPSKDPLCAAVQAGSGHYHNHKEASQRCDYDVAYADHGYSEGFLVRDSVRALLTNKTVLTANSVFGCGYNQRESLPVSDARTDGILGLGSGMASLPSQWAKQGLIKNVIGHCIFGAGRDGGYMFFGDDLVSTSAMTWVPMLGRPSIKHYYVGAAQMNFGNKPLDKDGDGKKLGGIIFDSGSTYTYFTNQAYGAFLSVVKENLSGKQLEQDSSDSFLSLCWRRKEGFRSVAEAAAYFKPLTLKFRSTKTKQMEIFPEGYLVVNKKGNVCLGILNGTAIGIVDTNVLGDISFQGQLVVYDNEKNQIGWARSDCQEISKL
uniref:Aspartic proteinase Asp1 n=1 Tax=Picea sitchensis TaxID=3332 RepID=B8LRU1_PICSI|nr:unknown [Picea sitchensis]